MIAEVYRSILITTVGVRLSDLLESTVQTLDANWGCKPKTAKIL
jgi:hypothetical protein